MRLTENRKVRFLGFSQRKEGEQFIADVYEKLSALEDIEEICQKIKKQPFYTKAAFTKRISKEDYTKYDSSYSFSKHSIEIYDYKNEQRIDSLPMEEYGVTWAITKEELE